jgi:hypothetical protein
MAGACLAAPRLFLASARMYRYAGYMQPPGCPSTMLHSDSGSPTSRKSSPDRRPCSLRAHFVSARERLHARLAVRDVFKSWRFGGMAITSRLCSRETCTSPEILLRPSQTKMVQRCRVFGSGQLQLNLTPSNCRGACFVHVSVFRRYLKEALPPRAPEEPATCILA